MKKFIYLVISLMITSTAIQADDFNNTECVEKESCHLEENNFYVKFLGGANFLRTRTQYGQYRYDDYCRYCRPHVGYLLSGSLGYRFSDSLSFEVEYSFRENVITRHAARNFYYLKYYTTNSCMVNFLWNLPVSNPWDVQPFVGGGIGRDFLEYYKGTFSWQFISGLNYPISPNTALSLEYRFHKGVYNATFSRTPNNHALGVGFVYKFNLESTLSLAKEKIVGLYSKR